MENCHQRGKKVHTLNISVKWSHDKLGSRRRSRGDEEAILTITFAFMETAMLRREEGEEREHGMMALI